MFTESVSGQFVKQLDLLIKSLNESVPRYVRCLRPNSKASPKPEDFDSNLVCEQLKSAGMLEAIRIRKIGYGYRENHEDFVAKFCPLLGSEPATLDIHSVVK